MCISCRLTIVGGGREAWSAWRRGRLGKVCARGACPTWSSGPSTSPLEATIVPPRRRRIERKIMRRVKAFRCAKWCVALTLLASAALMVRSEVDASLSIWVQLVGFAACGLALVATIGAVFYRMVETPQEVTVRGPWDWPPDPPVIHLDRKD